MATKESQTATLDEHGQSLPRTVEFCIANESLETDSAIVYFYPLGACSDVLSGLAQAVTNVNAKLICVNRPGCSNTSWEPEIDTRTQDEVVMHRIRTHVDDVMEVLLTERKIRKIYILGVCIGHAYAVDFARHLLEDQQKDHHHCLYQLCGLTLIAPFVSTECPNAWGVAKFGSHVPDWMLQVAGSVQSFMLPLSFKAMGPNMMKKFISPQEQEDFDWTEQDFEDTYERALDMMKKVNKCTGVEVKVGVSPVWQEKVCDEFAKQFRKYQTGHDWNFCIHASKEDKLASMASIEWIAERCYSPYCTVVVEDKIHSHELMTLFGGPARNPVLLYKTCKAWGLCNTAEDNKEGTT